MSKQGQGGGSSSGGHMRNTATASGAGAAATGSVPLPLPMPVAIRPGGGAAAVVDLAADSDADADSDSDIRVGATTGFANIGNTCYLSALLQVSCPMHPTQRNASENCSSEFLNTVSLTLQISVSCCCLGNFAVPPALPRVFAVVGQEQEVRVGRWLVAQSSICWLECE
jgi:hypothetical protein